MFAISSPGWGLSGCSAPASTGQEAVQGLYQAVGLGAFKWSFCLNRSWCGYTVLNERSRDYVGFLEDVDVGVEHWDLKQVHGFAGNYFDDEKQV